MLSVSGRMGGCAECEWEDGEGVLSVSGRMGGCAECEWEDGRVCLVSVNIWMQECGIWCA